MFEQPDFDMEDADQEQAVDDEDDAQEQFMIDFDQLSEEDLNMLLAYLQEEYEKNPDQFPFPKEKLEELLQAQDLRSAEGQMALQALAGAVSQTQKSEKKKRLSEERHAASENKVSSNENLNIEGGEQQVETEQNEIEMTEEQYQQLLQQQHE